MLAPTNKYSKGSKKVKNSRKKCNKKNKVALFIKDNLCGYCTYYTGQFIGDVT